MFDTDKWQEIFATIRKNKLRTILTAFGVYWGILMLVVLMGAGNALQNGVESDFGEEAKNAVWIDNGKTSIAYAGLKPGRRIDFDNDDIEAIMAEVGNDIDLLGSRNWFGGEYTINYKDKNGSFTVFGANDEFFRINGETLNKGRLLNKSDIKERRKVVILGERAKNVLFGEEESGIGEYIEIRGSYYQVVGIFNNPDNQGRNEERVYMPISTIQLLTNNQHINLFTITAIPGVSSVELSQKIKNILARRHKFDPKDEQAVYINNSEENYKRIMGLFFGIKSFIWFVSIGTLVAGIVGISNIMLIIVKERTKEIGIRKSLGATPYSIVSLILQESIFITAISGYLGLLVGVAFLELGNLATGGGAGFLKQFEIDLGLAISATVLLVLAGAIAGLIPALKAARVKPIEALRAD